jgi:glucose/arabinose dehydrogenase
MARRATDWLLVTALLLAATAPAAHGQPHPGYRVPLGNPFVTRPGAQPEVYVRGMRNPYRWSFDSQTGDMYVADVGGDQREEITYLPRAQIAGANLGWHCFEGTRIQKVCDPPDYFPPSHEYQSGPDVVIGGLVVHDPDLPSFAGRYLYGRYHSGLWVLGPRAAGAAVNVSTGITAVTSIGQDAAGHLFATSYDGRVYRLGESAGALTLTLIGGFDRPVEVLSLPGQANELFIVEKRGQVKLLSGGVASDFLDISDLVQDEGYEEGLLGFTAAPDYASSGRVFAFYSDNGGDIQIDEYRRTARDPDRSDPSTRTPLLTIQHDQGANHHGGQMNFGRDGYLYLSTGDGDLRADPQNDAQRLGSLLGKILRIDVRAGSVDTVAPSLHATTGSEQRVLALGGVVAYVGCAERCSLVASGGMRIGGRRYGLRSVGAVGGAGRRRRVKVLLTPACERALKRALKRDRQVSARISVRAEDATGNASRPLARTVRVTG